MATAAPKKQTAKPAKRTVSVLEYFAPDAKDRIDREAGIIRGVKLLGRVSKNGHRYSDKALRDAAKAYQNVTVNRNHPPNRNATAERLVEEPFGVIRDAKPVITGDDATDGVYGDHHFPLKDSWTESYLEKVDRFPNTLGFSHNAVVTESVHDGQVTFESVERARSVDLVANPATTRGIFESEGSMNPDDPNYVAPTMEGEPAEPEEPETEDSIRDALKQMVFAVFDDESCPIEEIRKKIAAILDLKEKLDGDGDEDEDDEPKDKGEPKDEPKDEPKKDDTESLQDRLTKAERQLKALNALESSRDALEKAGFRPSKVEVKAFAVLESSEERDEFIATLKKASGAATAAPERAKPRSTPAHVLESQKPTGGDKKPLGLPKSETELKELANQLARL